MIVNEIFRNSVGAATAAVIDFDGVRLLASRRVKNGVPEINLAVWGPAQGSASENPGWGKLDELYAAALVEYIYEGFSIAHDDRFVWHGEPFPGLEV